MGQADSQTLWTGQEPIVMDTLAADGRYLVKKQYIDQKYADTAWIFQEAYRFLRENAQKYLKKPDGAESPVWVYKDSRNIYMGPETRLLELSVPGTDVLLFDMHKWNKILNLSYIGTEEKEEEDFLRWLKNRGITDPLRIFSTGFYPVEKKEIIKSWNRLFADENIDSHDCQGMLWEVKREWIKTVKFPLE